MRTYWRLDGELPGTSESYEPSAWAPWVGMVIVAAIVALMPVAYHSAHYLGAPLADHVLGVSWEMEP